MLKGFKRMTVGLLILILSFSLCSCTSDNVYIKVNINKGDKFSIHSESNSSVVSNEKKYGVCNDEYSGSLECISKDDTSIKTEFKMKDNGMLMSDKDKEVLRIDDTNVKTLKIYNALNKIDGIIETDKDWNYVAFQMKDANVDQEASQYLNMDDYSRGLITVISNFNKKTLVKGESYDLGPDMISQYIEDIEAIVDIDPGNMSLKPVVSDITSKYVILKGDTEYNVESKTVKVNTKITIDRKTGVPAKVEANITVDNVDIIGEKKTGTAKIKDVVYITKK